MKKIAVLLFHANIHAIYEREWIEQCLQSLRDQTVQNFSLYEYCYNDDLFSGFCQTFPQKNREFYFSPLPNHVFAENAIIDIAYKHGFDYFFIVNLDDVYEPTRIEKQLQALEAGADLVSSDFSRFWENGETKFYEMHKLNFAEEAAKNHNILAHPVIAFNRNFWQKCRYFDVNGIPEEDFTMWKKAHSLGLKIHIVPEVLFHHRVHEKNVSREKAS